MVARSAELLGASATSRVGKRASSSKLGTTALCERARAELLLAGGRPRPPAGAGVDALTPAERRIAELAAQGATNREIARRLYLSPKTVEMHLRSCYRKLDVAGRADLARALGGADAEYRVGYRVRARGGRPRRPASWQP